MPPAGTLPARRPRPRVGGRGALRAALLAGLLCWLPAATAAEIQAWVGQQGQLQNVFIEALRAELAARPAHHLARITELGPEMALPGNPEAIVLAVGVEACRAAIERQARSVLGVLLSRRDAETLPPVTGDAAVTVVTLDQPLARQLRLVREVVPETKSVAVLLGTASAGRREELEREIGQQGMVARIESVAREADIVPALDRLLSPDAVLLSVPDAEIYNRNTAMSILLSTYRQRRPMIGFTGAYVRAGAVAAVFSTPQDVARQAAELLDGLGQSARPSLRVLAPTHYSVAVNERVLRSLALRVVDEAQLLDSLRRREEAP